jgi:hypothetical protein
MSLASRTLSGDSSEGKFEALNILRLVAGEKCDGEVE